MKKILFAFFMFLAAGALFAGPEKKTYEQAIKGNPADGVVVFLYGADWEKVGPKLLKTLWTNNKVRSACGGAPLVAIPIYQRPNEREEAQEKEKRKGFSLTKNVKSYPAIVMQTYAGSDYYVVYGDEILQPPEKVADLMKEKFELYKQQRNFLKAAEKAKGKAKAKAYAQAATIEGILPPPNFRKVIKDNDPQLSEPVCARAVFDVYEVFTNYTFKDKDNPNKKMFTVPEALSKLEELTSGDTYSVTQKQEIYAAATGFLRRNKYDKEKLKALYEKMIALAPESMWADVARQSITLWCK